MQCRLWNPAGPSVAARFASLPQPDRDSFLLSLTEGDKRDFYYDWDFWARPKQLVPDGDWTSWLYLGGRGSGKTRTASEAIRKYATSSPVRIALVAPTAADCRDVMIEGESGLLAVHPPDQRPIYEPSKRRLTWPNGSIAFTYSADEPERLRGPQHHYAWFDEPAACRYLQKVWDLLMPGLRLGIHPRVLLTTTPKPHDFFHSRINETTTVFTNASTWENQANLPASTLAYLRATYDGTDLGRQELEGILLGESPTALWRRSWLDGSRVNDPNAKLPPIDLIKDVTKIIIACDPSSSNKDTACECGIIVAALARDGDAYILADESYRATPMEWVKKLGDLRRKWKAQSIVFEANYGKGFIEDIFRLVDPGSVPYLKGVHAAQDKQTRAFPVSALTQKGRVHMVGTHRMLEQQLTTWTPGMTSPDRLDAMVWAIIELLVVRPPARGSFELPGWG